MSTKISELTNLAEVPDDADEFPFNDSTTTKAIAAGWLRRALVREITSSGAQSGAGVSHLHLVLNHGSAINYTITGAPTAGDILTVLVDTTALHTVILSGSVTWDGTNKTLNLGTDGESIYAVARSATRWDIISNNGGTLSA
jgi:hypothetical protein